MAEFVMPALGADMSAGTLTEWRKGPGDAVRRGDIVAVVETDKADVEVEVFADGEIERLLVEPGTKVPVGTPLALIHERGRARAQRAPEPPAAGPPAPAAPMAIGRAPGARQPRAAGERVLISPAARRLAEALGVDPRNVTGSGPGGRIVERDVHAAAEHAGAAPPRQARMRAAIAAAMSRSNREIPHYYLETTVDLGPALEWLRASNETRPVTERLLPGVLFLRATALAVREVPELNGHWLEDRHVPASAVHLGVAISLRGGGLVAPAIHDADQLTLADLMAAFRDVVNRARKGSLRSSELSDPTITVTSIGEQSIECLYGMIFPPQVAIVGFGAVVERPWVRRGGLFVAPVVRVTLSGDHRVTDGHRGAQLLSAIDRLLQAPEAL